MTTLAPGLQCKRRFRSFQWHGPGLVTAALALGSCGSYVPPLPGTHRAPGEATSEFICQYETPTATRFVQMRCRRPEDANRMADDAREAADNIRMPAPDIK
jgi:hypothetical protein